MKDSNCKLATRAKMESKNVMDWSVEDVISWLKDSGYRDHYISQCFENHKIDGKALLTLKEDDLKAMDIGVVGEIKRLNISIKQLQRENMPLLLELGYFELFSTQTLFSQQRQDVSRILNFY